MNVNTEKVLSKMLTGLENKDKELVVAFIQGMTVHRKIKESENSKCSKRGGFYERKKLLVSSFV